MVCREGLAHGITQSSAANYATGTFRFAASITIVPFPGVRIYAPGGISQFHPLRRYRQRGAMVKAKGY